MRSFKKALGKTLLFALLFALICTPSLTMYHICKSSNNNSLPELKENAGKIDLLFCGASQTVWGMVPTVMDSEYNCNSFNVASGLLSMEGRYTIIKQVLENNPVRTIVMDISYNGLTRSDETDTVEGELLLLEHLQGRTKLKYALTHIELDEVFPSFYYMLRSGTYSLMEKMMNLGMKEKEIPYRGKGYWGDHNARDQRGEVSWDKNLAETKEPFETDERTLEYLDKIMTLCHEKNIEVILVTTPYPTRVISWADRRAMLDEHLRLAQLYDCPLYDLNLYKEKLALFDDKTDYFDVEHLSTKGAVTMTKLLAQLLKAKDPGVGKSDLFYGSYQDMIAAYLQEHPN